MILKKNDQVRFTSSRIEDAIWTVRSVSQWRVEIAIPATNGGWRTKALTLAEAEAKLILVSAAPVPTAEQQRMKLVNGLAVWTRKRDEAAAMVETIEAELAGLDD